MRQDFVSILLVQGLFQYTKVADTTNLRQQTSPQPSLRRHVSTTRPVGFATCDMLSRYAGPASQPDPKIGQPVSSELGCLPAYIHRCSSRSFARGALDVYIHTRRAWVVVVSM
jgi:hypothetical protein